MYRVYGNMADKIKSKAKDKKILIKLGKLLFLNEEVNMDVLVREIMTIQLTMNKLKLN